MTSDEVCYMRFEDVYGSVLKEYPDIMSVEQVSRALNVSTKTVYRLLHEDKIGHIMMGRKYRVPKAHLLSYLRFDVKATANK
jgi:excisionase family DNA binding protein